MPALSLLTGPVDIAAIRSTLNTLIQSINNGVTGVLDVSPYFTAPGLAKLKDPKFFQRAHAHHGTVVWDGDVDLCPDSVWLESIKAAK